MSRDASDIESGLRLPAIAAALVNRLSAVPMGETGNDGAVRIVGVFVSVVAHMLRCSMQFFEHRHTFYTDRFVIKLTNDS